MMFRIAKTLVCFLLAVAAQAEITTSRVNVRVRGEGCDELKKLYLVINERDLKEQWVALTPGRETCHWTTDLGSGTISTSIARFSLRADSARSDCQKAAVSPDELSANLEFACCARDPLRNVSVKIEPSMPVSYFRVVRPFAGALVRGIEDCVERATFSEGQGSIGHTQFTGEDVYLHLGRAGRKKPGPGLLLDDVVVDDGTLVLTPDGVVYRLIVQRAKGKHRSAPTLSPNAADVDIKKLGELKLERAEIEVIK